ncbi:MAG: DUF4396 domain-containing protein [Hyphomonadaceae bacterium]
MAHEHHHHHPQDAAEAAASLNRIAFAATLHCLTGCAIGEVAGMMIGTALHWSNAQTILLAVILAFAFGYGLTMLPLLRAKLPLRRALGLALASDTASIAIMEIVDNFVMLLIPGAMSAPITSLLFWASLAAALALAGLAAYPVNRWLIKRGRGHAVLGAHHHH